MKKRTELKEKLQINENLINEENFKLQDKINVRLINRYNPHFINKK